MAAEDYLPDDLGANDDDYDFYSFRRRGPSNSPRCRRCSAYPLSWVHTGLRWAPYDGSKLHVCATKPAVSDFEPC